MENLEIHLRWLEKTISNVKTKAAKAYISTRIALMQNELDELRAFGNRTKQLRGLLRNLDRYQNRLNTVKQAWGL